MEREEYARIAAVEDEHWWYRNTRALMRELLEPWLRGGQRILDAGCGPGGTGAWLAEWGQVVGVDLAPEALRYVRERRPATDPVRASLTRLPFAAGSFDVVVTITVVAAIRDDAGAVDELARVLRPGGALLLIEPAFWILRRAHDVTVRNFHRYRRAQLMRLAERAGLSVRRATYSYSFLAAPAALLSVLERRKVRHAVGDRSDVERRGLDRVFAPLAAVERRWLRRHDVPFGTSVAVLATRERAAP